MWQIFKRVALSFGVHSDRVVLMKFKIVDKRINNLYVGPLSVFMFWPSLIFFGSWFMGDVISFKYLLYVFLFCIERQLRWPV